METFDIIIIGGGAAGLAAAIGTATSVGPAGGKPRTAIIEKMPRPARKMMITGKGRCNFTNLKDWNGFSAHVHPKANILKPAFYNLSPEKTIDMLNKAGLDTEAERGDRVFPASHKASDVVDTLVSMARTAGTSVITGCQAEEISAEGPDSGRRFRIKCSDGREFTCSKLVIATGGLSYPSTGSTGDGYVWAGQFGHKIERLFPSLTAIVPKNYKSIPDGKTASGTSEAQDPIRLKGHIDRTVPMSETGQCLNGNQLKNVSLTLWIDGNPVQEEFGDLDFTDGGIEGPLGFRVSRRCVNALTNGSKVQAVIDLKPAVSKEAIESRISRLWKEIAEDRRSSHRQYKDRFRILLAKLIPQDLIQGFLKCHPSIDHKTLGKALKNWRFDISGFVGYERCVITAGGVSQSEITAKTMESKCCKGLYFAGEVIDIDGDTGGYNLQIAFSTGYLAGHCAAESLSD